MCVCVFCDVLYDVCCHNQFQLNCSMEIVVSVWLWNAVQTHLNVWHAIIDEFVKIVSCLRRGDSLLLQWVVIFRWILDYICNGFNCASANGSERLVCKRTHCEVVTFR